MKHTQKIPTFLNYKRSKTQLLLHESTSLVTDDKSRKSSIVLFQSKQNEIDNRKVYIGHQHTSPGKKHKHCKSKPFINQYQGEMLLKSQSSKNIRTSLKDLEPNQVIKDGEMYNKISPKVVFKNDKMNVIFTSELNIYTQLNQPKMAGQNIEHTVQEVKKPRVVIKAPTSQGSPLRSNIKFSQGALSKHSSLFNSVLRHSEREQLNLGLKRSLEKLLRSQH